MMISQAHQVHGDWGTMLQLRKLSIYCCYCVCVNDNNNDIDDDMGNDNGNDDDDDGTNLFKLVRLVEVGDLSTAEDVVDVLQESLLHHLDVIEEEHCGLVLHTALEVQLLQV